MIVISGPLGGESWPLVMLVNSSRAFHNE